MTRVSPNPHPNGCPGCKPYDDVSDLLQRRPCATPGCEDHTTPMDGEHCHHCDAVAIDVAGLGHALRCFVRRAEVDALVDAIKDGAAEACVAYADTGRGPTVARTLAAKRLEILDGQLGARVQRLAALALEDR